MGIDGPRGSNGFGVIAQWSAQKARCMLSNGALDGVEGCAEEIGDRCGNAGRQPPITPPMRLVVVDDPLDAEVIEDVTSAPPIPLLEPTTIRQTLSEILD